MNLLKGRVADPEDPFVFRPPESGSGSAVRGTAPDQDHQAKIVRKSLIPPVL